MHYKKLACSSSDPHALWFVADSQVDLENARAWTMTAPSFLVRIP